MGASAAIGLTLVGGVIGAAGHLQAGEMNQQLSEYNARVADLQADDALARGRDLEGRLRLKGKQLIGTQRVRLAAQGIDVTRGSALDVQADTAAELERDIITVRNNAAREAWGYRVQVVDSRFRGEVAQTEAKYGALESLVTGGSRAAQFQATR
jgi:hypothetical protein